MPVKRSYQVGPYAMESGRYYVGDLSHVFDVTTWDDIIKHLTVFKDGQWAGMQGKYTLPNGRVVVMFYLPDYRPEGMRDLPGFRCRDYTDKEGRAYYVNTPSIGITLEEGLQSEYTEKPSEQSKSSIEYHNGEDWNGMVQRAAHVVEFEEDFTCTSLVDVLKDEDRAAPTFPHLRKEGGTSDVAVISFGDKVSIDTEENEDHDSDSDEEFLATMFAEGEAARKEAAAAREELAAYLAAPSAHGEAARKEIAGIYARTAPDLHGKKTVAKKSTVAKKTVAKKSTAAKKTVAKKSTAAKKTVAKKR
jgi:hypothetical protein